MLNALVGLYHLLLTLQEVVVGVEAIVVVVVLVVLVAPSWLDGWVVDAAVAADMATAEPFLLLAVTTTRKVEPTSAELAMYTWAFADAIAEHADPLLLQRCH